MSWWQALLAVAGAASGAAIAAELAYWRGYRHGQVAAWYGDPFDDWRTTWDDDAAAAPRPVCGCCDRWAVTVERGVPLCERHRALDPLRDE